MKVYCYGTKIHVQWLILVKIICILCRANLETGVHAECRQCQTLRQ